MKQSTSESLIPVSEPDTMPESENLIPVSKRNPDVRDGGGHTYCLYEISSARKNLELKGDCGALLYKKYKRVGVGGRGWASGKSHGWHKYGFDNCKYRNGYSRC